jgi:CubicO group peptidase (beta-lactamase class C family)
MLAAFVLAVAMLAAACASAQPGPDANAALHAAALTGDDAAVRELIAAGADPNARDAYGSTPLIIAATFGRPDVVSELIAAGADLDIQNGDGSSALHAAAFLGRTRIVEMLLAHGANKYLRNNGGDTALASVTIPFEAARPSYETIAKALAPLGLQLDYDAIRSARPGIAAMLRPTPAELQAVHYAPVSGGDWLVSTPAEQGLDPDRVAELYLNAGALGHLYSVLVIKNGRLVGERYFNGSSATDKALLQSVSKSFTSALVGLALENGCLAGLDQPMLAFFPDERSRVTDARKSRITLRQMLQMRAGFPWEETSDALWSALYAGDYLPLVADVPLSADPGTRFQYSNLTSSWLGIIVARACGTDLKAFAQEHLFGPLGITIGDWYREASGYYVGHAMMRFTARDAARFGLLYLQSGTWDGRQLLPAAWVRDSLRSYSEHAWPDIGAFHHIGYGYQWWSAQDGEHAVHFAWGHGGQLIVLVPDLDMIVVTTADPFFPGPRQDAESWRNEVAHLSLVSEFVRDLPVEYGER